VPEATQQRLQAEFRARYTDQVQQAAHTHFRGGIGLHQLLSLAARDGGYRGHERINDHNMVEVLRAAARASEIRADGGSTISLQNVLANVMNKFLLAGYMSVNQEWRKICLIRPTKDFKPLKDINIFGDFVFKKLGSDGQIANAAMSDEAYTVAIDTFARKLSIPRQTIVNDDLNALTFVPQLVGIGSADAISILVWSLWLNPGNAADGNPFFYQRSSQVNALGGGAAQSNLLSSGASSALSSAALQQATSLFDKQVKPNGQPLGVEPDILLYPPELHQAAWELCHSEFLIYGGASASRQPNRNMWMGRFQPVKVPYLSNPLYTGASPTAWYLLANPQRMAAIAVAFLNGQETPTVINVNLANQGNELGIAVVGYHDFGAGMYNFRGAVKSPGA
jgi:hypothetical protein